MRTAALSTDEVKNLKKFSNPANEGTDVLASEINIYVAIFLAW